LTQAAYAAFAFFRATGSSLLLGADSISGSGNAKIWSFDRPGLPTLSSYEQLVFGQLEQIHVVFILGSGVVLGEVPASELVEVGARVHGGVQVAQV
jgi:hypothetical protein